MRRTLRVIAIALLIGTFIESPARASWSTDVVANNGNSDSETSSLVVGPSGGRPFVSWQSSGSDDLYWAKWTSNGWRARIVAGESTILACYTTENDRVGPSAGFAADGAPRIASVCSAFGGGAKVLYSTLVNGSWKTNVVGYGPTGSCDSSATDVDLIANPDNDRPVIVITDQCTHAVTGFFFGSGGWTTKTLEPASGGPFIYGAIDLAVDPLTGKLALIDNTDVFGRGRMYLQEFTWTGAYASTYLDFTTVLPGEVAYGEPSLVFLPDGSLYAAFQKGSPYGTPAESAYSALALGRYIPGDFGIFAVGTIDDQVQFTGGEPSLSLPGGTPLIAYQDVTGGNLRYARLQDGTTWIMGTITGPNDTGYFPSLVVSTTGKEWITFYDRTKTALMYSVGP